MTSHDPDAGFEAMALNGWAGQSLEIFTRVAKVQGGCVGTAFWMSVAPDAQKHVPTSRYDLS
jgi:hypothetical protein